MQVQHGYIQDGLLQFGKPVTSSHIQLVPTTQVMVTVAGQGHHQGQQNVVMPTFTTVGKPISTPVPIASKPIMSVQQIGQSPTVTQTVVGM